MPELTRKQELINEIQNTWPSDRIMPSLLRELLLIMVDESGGGITPEVVNALAAVDERSNAVLRVAEEAQQAAAGLREYTDSKFVEAVDAANMQIRDLYLKSENLDGRVKVLETK